MIWRKMLILVVTISGGLFFVSQSHSQALTDIVSNVEGPWTDIEKTTLQVPKVGNDSIILDSNPSSSEYGGFEGVPVVPRDNAWILSFPGDRESDGEEDTSFTFYLAHDDNFLYVGIDAKDDILNSDDDNAAFWKDDAIEIIIDAANDDFDNNTDSSQDLYGGHCYANYEGRFSGWNDADNVWNGNTTWSTAVEYTYGENGDIYGQGEEVPGGWKMEIKFHKRLFEDPVTGIKLENGYVMGFNIGMDDDDKQGPGAGGSGVRSQDLEVQYFWANRLRPQGWNADEQDLLTDDELADPAFVTNYINQFFDFVIDDGGRLSHGGAGDIIFMAAVAVEHWDVF